MDTAYLGITLLFFVGCLGLIALFDKLQEKRS